MISAARREWRFAGRRETQRRAEEAGMPADWPRADPQRKHLAPALEQVGAPIGRLGRVRIM